MLPSKLQSSPDLVGDIVLSSMACFDSVAYSHVAIKVIHEEHGGFLMHEWRSAAIKPPHIRNINYMKPTQGTFGFFFFFLYNRHPPAVSVNDAAAN